MHPYKHDEKETGIEHSGFRLDKNDRYGEDPWAKGVLCSHQLELIL